MDFKEDQHQNLVLLMGMIMIITGFCLCLLRIILFRPRLFPCCCPSKWTRLHEPPPVTNPPLYSSASSALSAVAMVGVRYSRGKTFPRSSSVTVDRDLNREPNHREPNGQVVHAEQIEPERESRGSTLSLLEPHEVIMTRIEVTQC